MTEELQIYKDIQELIKRVFIIVKNFPREYKYTLGTKIQNLSLDCADLVYRAARSRDKKEILNDLISKSVRMWLELCGIHNKTILNLHKKFNQTKSEIRNRTTVY